MQARKWAMILGASSGFGAAASLAFAADGYGIIGVHLDRKSSMQEVERLVDKIKTQGVCVEFFNINAADPEARAQVLDRTRELVGSDGYINVLLHSLAFGSLKLFIAKSRTEALNQAQMDMTLNVMANSLVYWTQDLVWWNLIGAGSKIFAMTSSGSTRVIPTYGAVSAAKAALESHVRQLAAELAPKGIAVNAIKAGVTDTPALRKIPGNERLIEEAKKKNPGGRLTVPEDIGEALVALCRIKSAWLTGNVIAVDGGEDIVG